MIKSILRRLKEEHIKAFQEQKGQSIIIITFAFLGLIAMLGLALDLGLVYIEQVRISRTTDAAALAAVVELPFEEESMRRAIEYIQLNGYRVGEDTEVRVRGCINRPTGLKNVSSTELAASATIPLTPTNSITDSWVYIPATQGTPRAVFVIDTLGFEPVDYNTNGTVKTKNQEVCTGTVGNSSALYGSANKLRVAGLVNVDMNFMQFFGFKRVPVQDDAVGENVTNLDIAVVFDKSGSMDYETNCFGCWTPYPSNHANYDVIENPYPLNGAFSALKRADNTSICTAAPNYVVDTQAKRYLVHEAEYYSKEGPLHQGWLYSQRSPGRGYWALQKKLDGSTPIGSNGAYIRAHPLVTYSQAVLEEYPQLQGAAYNNECFSTGICWKARAEQLGEPTATKDEVPYVEYDFTPQWTDPTHIWVRAVGGSGYDFEWYGQSPKEVVGGKLLPWRESLYWQVSSGTVSSTVSGGPWDNLHSYGTNVKDGVASNADWRWVKLGSVQLTNGQKATLRLYQGSSGFNLDKIVFTNNPALSIGDAFTNTGGRIGSGSTSGSAANNYNALKAILQQNGGAGPAATNGSATRESCNICNPAFGQTVTSAQCRCPANHTEAAGTGVGTGQGCTIVPAGAPVNQLTNDLFSDIQPMRSAKEAVKNFAKRLDPKFDQLGFVVFSASVDNAYREKLQCLRYAQRLGDRARCYDEAHSQVFTYTNIFKAIERVDNTGNTNIAHGMVEGLEELGVNTPFNNGITSDCDLGSATSSGLNRGSNNKKPCDRRGGARRILILMTDGSPNEPDPEDKTSYCPNNLPASATWQGTGGSTLAYNCAIYYAQQAANNGVTVYTIGIGAGVNQDLLRVMAEGRSTVPGHTKVYIEGAKGKFYLASTQQDLDEIFKDILNNVVVRLVG